MAMLTQTRMEVQEAVQTLNYAPSRVMPGMGPGLSREVRETPVDPENPDSGKNPFQICFKRNQYYKILGDYEKLTTMEYVLQVTVNPNWDGDVYLPLDKSDDSN
ncbi:hypothetical protein [Phocaeicola coprophilus]|uniref:hypothetical protein n=1 Tax=Phocaeicola coprophilus TaxID=387090 RepID=UPI003992E96F